MARYSLMLLPALICLASCGGTPVHWGDTEAAKIAQKDAEAKYSAASSCNSNSAFAVRSEDAIVVEDAKKRVLNSLKDPASAQFQCVIVNHVTQPTVCGEVNARNGYGGYSGFTQFVVNANRQVFLNVPINGDYNAAMNAEDFYKQWHLFCQ
jgi:hypothetical protein